LADPLCFALCNFEVDVGFPQQLQMEIAQHEYV
jgi:hypothetical protein